MSWTLTITPEQYVEIYKGTSVISAISLFENNPSTEKELFTTYFPSKLWRLNSGIYHIKDKDGQDIPFKMNWTQHKAYAAYLTYKRLLLYKSRQRGISTFWLISFFDDSLVIPNLSCGLMAQGLSESLELRDKIIFAWEHLHPSVKRYLGIDQEAKNSSVFKLSNQSKIMVATSFRSRTLQRLHVSEIAKIGREHPERLQEFKAGTLQAIKLGLPVIIESTGENTALFRQDWEATVPIDKAYEELFGGVFLGWWEDPECNSIREYEPDTECDLYFIKLIREVKAFSGMDLVLSNGQKAWWRNKFIHTFHRVVIKMAQEYPGYPNEIFDSAIEGSYYAKLYLEHIKDKQEVERLYDPSLPVYVGSDLGYNDTACFLFFQLAVNEIRIVGEIHSSKVSINWYIQRFREVNMRIDLIYLPHDAGHMNMQTGVTTFDILSRNGFPCVVLDKTQSVIADINVVRSVIPSIFIDKELHYIKDTFINYSKQWDSATASYRDKPKHDDWSNPADAMRIGIIGLFNDYISDEDKPMTPYVEERKRLSNTKSGDIVDVPVYDGLAL